MRAAFLAILLQSAASENEAVISRWLAANAIPLRTVVAGGSTADLQPLKTVLRDVRVVGLGEATHGTREFFQAKHRLLEFLVKEMGFRTFAIEASQAGSEVINDYVMGRMSDGARALDSQGFWTWNTEEMRAMIDWMRSYNASVPAAKRVRFVGFDFQANWRGAELLTAYLLKVAPERAAQMKRLPLPRNYVGNDRDTANSMEAVVMGARTGIDPKGNAARVREIHSWYTELRRYLTLNQAALTKRTSAREFADAARYTQLIIQFLEVVTPGASPSLRDEYMARNIVTIVNTSSPGEKVVVWGHNGHIERAAPMAGYRPMGSVLASVYGRAYYALSFSFNQGSFQARSDGFMADKTLKSFTVGPLEGKTFEWFLALPRIPLYVIDFRRASSNLPIHTWLSTEHSMRSIGAVYSDSYPLARVIPIQQFDGVLFISRTTRARPNPSVRNVAR